MSGHCLISGGQGGLGLACAAVFGEAEWRVDFPGREQLDVCDLLSVENWFDRYASLDLCVCNAGITVDRPLMKMEEEAWDDVQAVNLKGAMRCARAAAKVMLKQRSGHIVFISSHSAYYPPAGQVNYAAAKAALEGLAKSLARELGGKGIRVNVIVPGFLQTKMTSSLTQTAKEKVLEKHVLGRLNTPECVARFMRFLHEEMPHTSGQVFHLDSRIV